MTTTSSAKYLFRLDDICPTMNWQRFNQLLTLFDSYDIKPILGVVPDVQDSKLQISSPAPDFWLRMKDCEQAGWIIAQHGYQHRYTTKNSGLLGLRTRSEFAGLSYDVQYAKIAAGQKILERHLTKPVTWWTAPAHSFDAITCQVLRELNFTHISDGIALYSFKAHGLTWVPHQLWAPRPRPFGLWTVGLHLNTMSDQSFDRLARFISLHANQCQNISLQPRSHLLTKLYRQTWYLNFRSQKYVRTIISNLTPKT